MSQITAVNYYEVLGIKSDATIKDINTAYKKLALKHHPDKTGNAETSQTEFQKIQQAVETLRDPLRRKKHDLELVRQGKISVQETTFPRAGGSQWMGCPFKRYGDNSRYMYSYENSVHVSPQKDESKEDMAWVEQMMKAEEEYRQYLADLKEQEAMRAQMAADEEGQKENGRQPWDEGHPGPFQRYTYTKNHFQVEEDEWDFYYSYSDMPEGIYRKDQDFWDRCARRAPQQRRYEQEERYQGYYQEAEEQEDLYGDDVEDQQELYEEGEEEVAEQHVSYETDIEHQQGPYEEEAFHEDYNDEQGVYEQDYSERDFDIDESSFFPDDQRSEYIPSACESDGDYQTAQSNDSAFQSRFDMESAGASRRNGDKNMSAKAQKPEDDTGIFYDFSEEGATHTTYHTNPQPMEDLIDLESDEEDENELPLSETDHSDVSDKPSLRSVLTPFIPYFTTKLDDPSGRYTDEDIRVELRGIVMETFCGWLENVRLTVPNAEILKTGNNPQQCLHLGAWTKQFERPECEACHRWRPIYTLICPGCGIKACVGCKFQYGEE